MKKTLFGLLVSVFLFGNSVDASHCEPMVAKVFQDGTGSVLDPRFSKLIADIYFEDLKWRKPNVNFYWTDEYVTDANNNSVIYDVLTGYYPDGGIYYQTRTIKGYDGKPHILNLARNFTVNHGLMINPLYSLPPILPTMIRETMDFNCLPIGFKILNPENGLGEEMWDGLKWLKRGEKSNLNIDPGYMSGTTE